MHKTINTTSENVFQVPCGPTGYARNGGTNDAQLMDDVLYFLTS